MAIEKGSSVLKMRCYCQPLPLIRNRSLGNDPKSIFPTSSSFYRMTSTFSSAYS